MSLDPTRFQVETHGNPLLDNEPTFQELMGDQIKHAPWLLLSIVLHAIVFVIFWLMPTTRIEQDNKQIAMQPPPPEKPIEEPPPPEPEPEKEEVKEEVVLQDMEVTEVVEEVFEEFTQDTKESAFDSNAWNSAIGLGGGAGGPRGGRRGGRAGLGAKGGRATAAAIEAGLEWLKNHQDEDGKWDADEFMKHDVEGTPCDGAGNAVHDVGLTGLALLAFLGDGSTLRSGPYRDVIKKGINWLRQQQDDTSGLFGTNASHDFIYDHILAAYAMCEAYGLSESSILRPYAQKAVNYLEFHRNPYMVWRYQPRDNDNDTSVTGWGVMVYKSAEDFKLQVNEQALKNIEIWFDQVTDPATGKAGYTKRGEPSSRHPGDHSVRFPPDKGEALTAAALLGRFFLGQNPKDKPIMTTAANTILSKPPIWDTKAGTIDYYYWYYASYALYQMGGRHWKEWSSKLTDAVVKSQRQDGNFKGSWDPIDAWGQDGGRVYSTAILVLTLEAYYRYTALIR